MKAYYSWPERKRVLRNDVVMVDIRQTYDDWVTTDPDDCELEGRIEDVYSRSRVWVYIRGFGSTVYPLKKIRLIQRAKRNRKNTA